MRTVVVKARNIKVGDRLIRNGKRQTVKAKHVHPRRDGSSGVLLIMPNPNGYKLDTVQFKGGDSVAIKRPIHNMKRRVKR